MWGWERGKVYEHKWHRVTHKELDKKDDLTHFKYFIVQKKRSNFIVVGNNEHKKTDCLNSVESYLNSHPF